MNIGQIMKKYDIDQEQFMEFMILLQSMCTLMDMPDEDLVTLIKMMLEKKREWGDEVPSLQA